MLGAMLEIYLLTHQILTRMRTDGGTRIVVYGILDVLGNPLVSSCAGEPRQCMDKHVAMSTGVAVAQSIGLAGAADAATRHMQLEGCRVTPHDTNLPQ